MPLEVIGGGGSASPAPSYYAGGVWAALRSHLALIAAASSTESLTVVCNGDSKTEGDLLARAYRDSWPAALNAQLQPLLKCSGATKHAEWIGVGELAGTPPPSGTGNSLIDIATGVSAPVDNARRSVIAAGGSLAVYLADGAQHLACLMDGYGHYQIDVYAGDVRSSLPATNTGLAHKDSTGGDYPVNTFPAQTDANGNAFGSANGVIVTIATGLSLASQTSGCTVVFRAPYGANYSIKSILVQKGGSARNYVAVANEGLWGSDAALYDDPTQRFNRIKRYLKAYQEYAQASTTHAASKVLCLYAQYTNANPSFATKSGAEIAATVQTARTVRDELAALGSYFAWVHVPPSDRENNAGFASYVTQMKAMCLESPLSGYVCSGDLLGYDRAALEAVSHVMSDRRDHVHEGAETNRFTASLVAGAIRGGVL